MRSVVQVEQMKKHDIVTIGFQIYILDILSSRPLKHDDQGKSEPPGRPAVKSGVWLSCGISGIGGFGLWVWDGCSEEKERGEIWLEEGLEEDAENRDGVEELDDNEEEGRIV